MYEGENIVEAGDIDIQEETVEVIVDSDERGGEHNG